MNAIVPHVPQFYARAYARERNIYFSFGNTNKYLYWLSIDYHLKNIYLFFKNAIYIIFSGGRGGQTLYPLWP
jgi:hypothetical protein